MTKQTSRPPRGTAAIMALVVGIAVSSLLLSIVLAQEPTPTALTETAGAQFDGIVIGSNADLARQGTIFFAQVIDVVLIRTERETTPDAIFPKIIYAVHVDRSLRGDASGQVNVSFLDPRLELTRNEASGPLAIGERYLFFAGALTSQGYYPVDLEFGFTPVRDGQHAEELAAEFMPLVQQAEQEERALQRQLSVAARAEPSTPPEAAIAPSRGEAGIEVQVSGSGFTPPEVLLYWGEGSVELIEVSDDGRFEATVTVPDGLGSGRHAIDIEGSGSDRATVTFVVD